MATKAELGKSFLDELVGKLPADKQDSVRTILSSPEAAAALEHAGSRLSPLEGERARLEQQQTQLANQEARLTRWHEDLATWKKNTEADFVDRDKKLTEREAGGGRTPPAAPEPGAPKGVTPEEISDAIGKVLAQREPAYVKYVADVSRIGAQHQLQFKEVLDVDALIRHPKIGELGFEGVYREVHAEKLQKLEADRKVAEREQIRAEERAKILAEAPVDMPYPIASEGSPLDVLSLDPTKRPAGDPASAAREYERLVAAGGSR